MLLRKYYFGQKKTSRILYTDSNILANKRALHLLNQMFMKIPAPPPLIFSSPCWAKPKRAPFRGTGRTEDEGGR